MIPRLARAVAVAVGTVVQLPLLALAAVVFRRIVFAKRSKERVIALTVDDAPSVLTPRVVEMLEKHGAHATFFVIGSSAKEQPAMLECIVQGGHELGNHSWHDESTCRLSEEKLRQNLLLTHRVLTATGQPVHFFRPGAGCVNRRIMKSAKGFGYTCVLGLVYPNDIRIPSDQFVVLYLLWAVRLLGLPPLRLRPVVILHEGKKERERVVRVLDEVLGKLRQGRYRVVTVSELLSLDLQWSWGQVLR